MKKTLTCFFLAALLTSSAVAADVKTVAVLPFAVHSAENIDYVKKGVWEMLIIRIAVNGKIDVLGRHAINEAMGSSGADDMTPADAVALGKKAKADYVVWGSITKIGNSVSLDGKLIETSSAKSPVSVFAQSQGLDDVVNKVSDFAKRIDIHLIGQAPTSFDQPAAAPTPAPAASAASSAQATLATALIPAGAVSAKGFRDAEASEVLTSKKGTLTSLINPDFIVLGNERSGFWMSNKYDMEFKGVAVGDIDGDGQNEIVVIDHRNVRIFRKVGKDLNLIYSLPGKPSSNYLAVDVADIKGTGTKQIFVTSQTGSIINSFVLEYKDKKFVRVASDLKWFFRVIENSSGTMLLGQTMGMEKPFSNPIHEIVWDNGKFVEGRQIKVPRGISIYGMTVERLDKSGEEMTITLDDFDHLAVCEETDLPLERLQKVFGAKICTRTDDDYGGTKNFLDFSPSQHSNTSDSVESRMLSFINVRILTYDFNKDGKRDVIVVKNLSPVGRALSNVRMYNASEIYNLGWDGSGLVENWKTRKITGYVADYQIKDVANTGVPELILVLVNGSQSRLVTFSLSPKQL